MLAESTSSNEDLDEMELAYEPSRPALGPFSEVPGALLLTLLSRASRARRLGSLGDGAGYSPGPGVSFACFEAITIGVSLACLSQTTPPPVRALAWEY